jgi:GNAT superfamily N-acetyltransferase
VQLAIPEDGEDRARAFYGDVLGLVEIPKPAALAARGGAWFQGGGLEVHLGIEEPFAPAKKAHPGILTEDLEGLRARLAHAGIEVRTDDHLPGFQRFYVDDCFGNRLEFLQPIADLSVIRGPNENAAAEVCRLLASLGYPAEVEAVRERIASFATSHRDHVLLAELDGQVVGFLALSLTPRFAEPGMFSRITALAVDPSAQRVGVGRRLVTEAERIAAANESTLMEVNSGRRPERAAAHAFYLALGYADQHDHHVLYEKTLAPG